MFFVFFLTSLHTQVFIPVLQRMDRNEQEIGHYFLIVLNLRNNRFEVLDSMRSMEDKSLESCCITITSGIKRLWEMHYAGSSKAIGDYEITEIQVQKQKNKYVSPHSSSSFFLFDSHFFFTHPY